MECKYFNAGACRYGSSCRYLHIPKSALLDPPSWLLTGYTENNTCILGEFSYSFEEVRYSYYLARKEGPEALKNFFIQWNSMLLHAHSEYSSRITSLLAQGKVNPPDTRRVDLRDPSTHYLFIQPVDVEATVSLSLTDSLSSFTPAETYTPPPSEPSNPPNPSSLSEEEYALGEIPTEPPG